MTGGGILSTVMDANVPPTTGDQNTAVEFIGFLDGRFCRHQYADRFVHDERLGSRARLA